MKNAHGLLTYLLMALVLAVAGCTGDAGKPGADGMKGTDGVNGKNGTNGTNGTNGVDGAKGADGVNGTDGIDGIDGMEGGDGDGGLDGHDGHDGQDGLMGAMGAPGASGIIDRTKLTGVSVIYPLTADQSSGVTGSVRFAEFVDGTTHGTLVTIRVTGTIAPDTIRVSHIHYNSVAVGGSPAVTLNKVDGFTADGTAMSETLVTHVNPTAANAADATEVFVAGAPITYQDLVGTGPGTGFNGYVNVHVISTDPVANTASTASIASGNIGKNF